MNVDCLNFFLRCQTVKYALLKFVDVNRVSVFDCCIVLFQALFNGPFTSCPQPLFQSKAKCKVIDMKMIFHSHANKTHFRLERFCTSPRV